MNDIDIIVGVKDFATSVLDRLSLKVNSIGGSAKDAFTGAAERLNDQLAKVSSGAGGVGNDRIAKAIENAANGLSTKLDAAVAKTNASIDSITSRVQGAITSVSTFVTKAAAIASVGAAFITVGRGVWGATGSLADFVLGSNKAEASTQKLKVGVLSSLAPFSRYIVAAGATVTLTNATLKATSATSGLVEKTLAVGRGALAAFVLRNAMKKTEEGATTLGAKIAKIAGFALAFDVAARASVRFGLSLLGIGAKADATTVAISKTVTAAGRITAAPLKAVANGASAAAASTANLASKIEDLPRGAQSINTLVSGFGNFAAQLGGIPGLLLAIPAGIAGIAFAAVTSAGKTERQLTELTNKLALVEAAKRNVFLGDIDTTPLRKAAIDVEKIAKQIQTATGVQSSKLISLATSSLTKGLDTAQIGEFLKASVGFAEVYGTSIEDGAYRARQAMEGNFESFEKLIPSLKDMTNVEFKMAAVSKLAANGFKVMSMEGATLWGTIEKVKNGLGNTVEALGRFKSLSDVVGTVLRDVVAPAVKELDRTLKVFGFDGKALMASATRLGANVVATIETIRDNWGLVLERMSLSNQLFWDRLANQALYFADVVVPWMVQKVKNVISDAMIDVANKISASFAGIAGMFGAKINPSLISFSKPVPALKERAIPAQESVLAFRIKAIDAQLGGAFITNFLKAMNVFSGLLKDQEKIGNINLKANATKATPVDAAVEKTSKATDRALQAFQSRLLTRAPSNDPQMQMVASLKTIQKQSAETNKAMREESEWLKKLYERPGFRPSLVQ